MSQHRVIAHLDLDCFYAQVEQVRLGLDPVTPLAVYQWDGLLAVNYAARPFGIKRGMRCAQATKLCPSLRLVHVPLISSQVPVDEEAAHDSQSPPPGERREESKVSLERYREASNQIFRVLSEHFKIVERASIDEAYVDLTEEAFAEKKEEKLPRGEDDLPPSTFVVDSARLTAVDGPMCAGARCIARCSRSNLALGGKDTKCSSHSCRRVRGLIRSQLGYTISAGLSHNKLLSKLASARNKPDKVAPEPDPIIIHG